MLGGGGGGGLGVIIATVSREGITEKVTFGERLE